MNELVKTPTPPPVTNGSNQRPKWWTEHVEASWNTVKGEAIADWKKIVASEKKVESTIDEQALAFGHGAREAYKQLQTWGEDLEARLKADWKETSCEAEYAWEQVCRTVQHGWQRAVATVKPPAPPTTP